MAGAAEARIRQGAEDRSPQSTQPTEPTVDTSAAAPPVVLVCLR